MEKNIFKVNLILLSAYSAVLLRDVNIFFEILYYIIFPFTFVLSNLSRPIYFFSGLYIIYSARSIKGIIEKMAKKEVVEGLLFLNLIISIVIIYMMSKVLVFTTI